MTHFDYGNPDAPVVLLEPQGGHDPVSEQKEYELIREFSGREDFLLVTVPVDSWNRDLSPWNAPPVFGKEPFGDGAKETLRRIEEELIPAFPVTGSSFWAAIRLQAFLPYGRLMKAAVFPVLQPVRPRSGSRVSWIFRKITRSGPILFT